MIGEQPNLEKAKVGMDATHFGLVELVWPDEACTVPIVNKRFN
jgi:hypothetical protein